MSILLGLIAAACAGYAGWRYERDLNGGIAAGAVITGIIVWWIAERLFGW